MDKRLSDAFATGYERLSAWSDLLDDINLFPVADSDTGRNLRISLAALRNAGRSQTAEQLLLTATGNSGNIAAAFFSKFVTIQSETEIGAAAETGRQAAWKALLDPKPGTMLTLFDSLCEALADAPQLHTKDAANDVLHRLKAAVLSTAQILPTLKQAGVVDAGALGLFLFFEGFVKHLAALAETFHSPTELFGNALVINGAAESEPDDRYCIDTVLRIDGGTEASLERIAALGDSVVALPDRNLLKIHFHTDSGESAKQTLADLGTVVRWNQEKIEVTDADHRIPVKDSAEIHIATDAAGSLTRKAAQDLGVTLLDSYLIIGDRHVPETLVEPEELYDAMRRGVRVTTAQASTFERHQCYQSLVNRHQRTLYLCVGSVYTGNFKIARQWSDTHAANGRMVVVDSTAASGRLALIATALARSRNAGRPARRLLDDAQELIERCDELVFLDQLKYLAAGGRISKTRGFFGDLMKFKPVISPSAQGAEKVGIVKNRQEQLRFALQHMQPLLDLKRSATILLQHTDNRDWVESEAADTIAAKFPNAEISIGPMSLTSGAHMGPGTWAAAFLPETAIDDRA
jgi:DegV family protein with EDD domain